MSKLRDIPIEGQDIEFNQFEIVVKKMDGPRIDLVQIYPDETIDL
jgi:CBS domain containing-hemolysin-like protein